MDFFRELREVTFALGAAGVAAAITVRLRTMAARSDMCARLGKAALVDRDTVRPTGATPPS